jgi:hypothetical protein
MYMCTVCYKCHGACNIYVCALYSYYYYYGNGYVHVTCMHVPCVCNMHACNMYACNMCTSMPHKLCSMQHVCMYSLPRLHACTSRYVSFGVGNKFWNIQYQNVCVSQHICLHLARSSRVHDYCFSWFCAASLCNPSSCLCIIAPTISSHFFYCFW